MSQCGFVIDYFCGHIDSLYHYYEEFGIACIAHAEGFDFIFAKPAVIYPSNCSGVNIPVWVAYSSPTSEINKLVG